MNVLIVYSNHHGGNFNARLLEHIRQYLKQSGWPLVVRDLYSLDFEPVLRKQDFELISAGNPPDDIRKEQEFISWADLIVFIYPIWWGGMPALVKGYIDRVFSWGFAYGTGDNGVYPMLSGKRAIVMNSLGQSSEEYEKGMFQAMSLVNKEGIFEFCGIEVLQQIYFSSIHDLTPQKEAQYFLQAQTVLERIPIVQND